MLSKALVSILCVFVLLTALGSCSNPTIFVIQEAGTDQKNSADQNPSGETPDADQPDPDDPEEGNEADGDDETDSEDEGGTDDLNDTDDEDENDPGTVEDPDDDDGSGDGEGQGNGSDSEDEPDNDGSDDGAEPDDGGGSGDGEGQGSGSDSEDEPDNDDGGSDAGDEPGDGDGSDDGEGQGNGEGSGAGDQPGVALTGSAEVQAYLDGQEGNTETTPYRIKVGDINLASTGAGNALKGLYLALSRFVALDLSESYGNKFANVAPTTALNKDKITGIILPPGLYTIDVNALVGYENLVSADLSGVTTINNGAFSGCAKLETLVMEEVTDIVDATKSGKGVFQGCDSLVSVSLPKITKIGDSAFKGCTNLKHIVLGETPPTLGDSVFADGKPEAIYVPASAVNTYKNTDVTGWTEALKAKVQAIP
jgi:hypothetical protein